jgi:hypothetical protein
MPCCGALADPKTDATRFSAPIVWWDPLKLRESLPTAGAGACDGTNPTPYDSKGVVGVNGIVDVDPEL